LITDVSELKQIQADLEMANKALVASQNALENEKRMLETILFGLEDSVIVFDTAGSILLSNPLGRKIEGQRTAPNFPINLGEQKRLQLQLDSEMRHFVGERRQILNHQGSEYAYVETLRDITDQIRLQERESELIRIRRRIRYEELASKIIGVSRAMQNVFDIILRCSETDSTILLLGETGVGKELAARAIHNKSARKDKPFVAVNCGALPETLLESELFGHVKGAFTGAISERMGLFREAEGGTLFLDEVGDLSGPLQVKLLRALQEKVIRPVGKDSSYPVDVRIIAATNRNLKELVDRGAFREDLYYRIAVIPFPIPPLRQRREDILLLAEHFLRKHAKAKETDAKRLDSAAQKLLVDYSWPGNVRELENAIEYALVMSPGTEITADAFPLQSKQEIKPQFDDFRAEAEQHSINGESPSPGQTDQLSAAASQSTLSNRSQEFEKQTIIEALERSAGNKSAAARDLGISLLTISRKIKKYNIS
jgi:transcriptional regulator with PAS, ATPase and Fis domain